MQTRKLHLHLLLHLKPWSSKVLIFCVGFWELSHLTRDLTISSWEENECFCKLSKCTIWLFHSKLLKLSFWVKIVVILLVAQLVTTVTAWDKSHVKWDNSQNSTQKMRTFSVDMSTNLFQFWQFCWEISLGICAWRNFASKPAWLISLYYSQFFLQIILCFLGTILVFN